MHVGAFVVKSVLPDEQAAQALEKAVDSAYRWRYFDNGEFAPMRGVPNQFLGNECSFMLRV